MISIIIPTLNAQDKLADCFHPLVEAMVEGLVKEVIVVDGGSSDETVDVARAAGAKLVTSPKGRGQQLSKGGKEAVSEWLLFLHADTVLEPHWWRVLSDFMRSEKVTKAATFEFRLDQTTLMTSFMQKMVKWRSHWLHRPYGDQGLLIRRDFYHEIGGYKPLCLMEDVDIIRRIKRADLTHLPIQATTSAARYQANGYFQRIMRNQICYFAYRLGVRPEVLVRFYEK